jgi:hypothetical protein
VPKIPVEVQLVSAGVVGLIFVTAFYHPKPVAARPVQQAAPIAVSPRAYPILKEPLEVGYIYEPRAELCFAVGWHGGMSGGPLFTNVPCTLRVMGLAQQPRPQE